MGRGGRGDAIGRPRRRPVSGTRPCMPAWRTRWETRDAATVADDSMVPKLAVLADRGEMPLYYRKPLDEQTRGALGWMYDVARTERLGKLAAQNEATGRVLAAYGERIDAVKQAARSLSFADVSVRLARLVSRTDIGSLADRSDVACDHLLLDEFQDTSPVQWVGAATDGGEGRLNRDTHPPTVRSFASATPSRRSTAGAAGWRRSLTRSPAKSTACGWVSKTCRTAPAP